jgi:hypothetical protein
MFDEVCALTLGGSKLIVVFPLDVLFLLLEVISSNLGLKSTLFDMSIATSAS